MATYGKFVWGQKGMDIPEYSPGKLRSNPTPYLIERPHGQSMVNLDVLVEVLLESETTKQRSTFSQALLLLRDYEQLRNTNPQGRRLPNVSRTWITRRAQAGLPPLQAS